MAALGAGVLSPAPARAQTTPVTDVTLSGLALSEGTLKPAFSPAQTHYIAGVRSAISRVTLTPTTTDPRARVAYFDPEDAIEVGRYIVVNPEAPPEEHQLQQIAPVVVRPPLADADTSSPGSFEIDLARGRNVFEIEVSGSGGAIKRTYTLEITRGPLISTLSSDAALSALALSEGTLSPAFTRAQTRYVARVQPATSRITVTPASHPDATIAWLDAEGAALADADPGTTGFQVDLASGTGPRVFKMRVTAASGHTRTYQVTVSRNASGCGAPEAGELWCAVMTVAKKPKSSGVVGYGDFGIAGSIAGIAPHGSLSQTTFVHRGVTARVSEVVYQIKDNRLRFRASIPNNGGPRGGFFGDDDYVLEVGTGADKRNFGIQSPGAGTGFSFDAAGLTWSVGDRVLVRLKSAQATTIAPPVVQGAPFITGFGGRGDDGWSRGEVVVVILNFDKPVYVSRGPGRNPPSIGIELGGVPANARRAQYIRGSGSTTLTFMYQMQPGDGTHHAMRVTPDSLAQNRGVIMGLASPNPAALLGHAGAFWATPTLPCESYANEIWCATLTVGGPAAMGFDISGAGYGSLSNTQVSYGGTNYPIGALTVVPGPTIPFPQSHVRLSFDQDGAAAVFHKAGFTLHLGTLSFALPAATIDVNEKTVTWTTGAHAALEAGEELFVRLTGPPASSQQVEVAPPPVVEGAPAIGGTGTWSEGDDVEVTVTFSEAVAVDTAGGTPGIGVQLGASPANPRSAEYASGSGTAELVFRYTLAAGDGAHSAMAVTGDSLALNGGTIRSVETGTDATLAHNGAVVVRIAGRGTGPEVSFPGLPENHDGQNGFEVRVRFSGAPSGLSAQRDAASVLEVEGGTVTGATAETKAADSPWAVTVAPDGGGEVTMRVPVRDCAEPGAVCIGGQPLARAAEATVPGPQISACPAPALTGGAVLVWTGQLGLAKWPGKEYYGFGNGVRGTLDDRDFTLGSNDYLVDHVTQRGGSSGPLLFSLESRLSADEKRTLTLHACEDGKQLRFSDASGPSRWDTYRWRRTGGLDWSGHAGRTLYLSRDAAAPTLTAATVAGTSLALAFSETLAAASGLGASAFTVTADGDAAAVSSVQVDAGTVTLTLASPVSAGAAVTVSYARPAGAGNRLRDRFGNLVANLTDRIVDSGTAAPALPAVSIAAASTPVTEGTPASFTLERSGDAAAALTVRVSVSETGAMASGTPPTEVAFAAGSASATLSVATEDDEAVESASTVTAALTADAGYTVDGSSGSAEVAVEDDDAAPAVTTATTIEVAENATAVASLAATDEDTPVGNLAWSIPEGEAGGADAAAFEVTAEGVLTFGTAKDFEAPDDADADGEYQVTVRVTDGANPVDAVLVVRLADADEAAPVLSSVAVDGAALALGFGEALDEASPPAAAAFEVSVGTGNRAVEAVALAGDTVTLTLASAVTAGETVTVSYTAPDEPDPGLRDASGNRVAGFADAEVTNGTAAVLAAVSIAPESTPVTEGTAASFTLTRTGSTAAALEVSVSVGEAGSVLDGTPPSSAIFAAGASHTQLAVATLNDAAHEADARVTASVVAGAGYTVDGATASAGVDVFDDDTAPPGQQEAVETLWSTTMRWADVGYGWYGGYAEAFDEPAWTEDGKTFRIWFIDYHKPRRELRIAQDGSGGRIADPEELSLQIGGYTVEDQAVTEFAGVRTGVVRRIRSQWTAGEEIEIRLTRRTGETQTTPAAPGVSVADAQVNEASGTPLRFTLRLAEPSQTTVSVRYATSDGTARAGSDYVGRRGAVRFAPGQTEKTVAIEVLPDNHDEGAETMTLTLSRPWGAALADAAATGTISNTDPMPAAWLARFGRTVAEQAIEAVQSRFDAWRGAGFAGTVAGHALGGGEAAPDGREKEAERSLGTLTGWLRGEAEDQDDARGFRQRGIGARELLAGSSFSLTGGTAETGSGSFWGRGAVTRFDGRDGEVTLDGEVSSAMLGADFSRDRLLAGLMLSHSRGAGGYSGGSGRGTVESTLTALFPYARFALGDRLSVWGMAGYGAGTLTLTPEGQAPLRPDLDLAMGALGVRSVLLDGGADEATLTAKSDAYAVRTGTDAVSGDTGRLEAARADVSRVRLALEGSRPFSLSGSAVFTPSLELGVRHDGGDAETGFGADIGAGLALSDPSRGLSAELRARGLLTHEDGSMRERGVSGTLAFDPAPETGRGLSVSVTQTMGGQAWGGADALLERTTLAGLGADDGGGLSARRLDARVGYGFGVLDERYTATPELGFGLAGAERELRLGWRLAERVSSGLAFELELGGTRRALAGAVARHGFTAGAGWRLFGRGAAAFGLHLEGALHEAENDARPEAAIGLRLGASW
ncbi:MAG: SwmB domain-containing protein [Defluviicoccus sp.]|nr:SwmB domain-containing protein [Defluviicoccus sp.]